MIVRHVDEIRGTDADASGPGWQSLRFGVRKDNLGFTMTETTLEPSDDKILWYKNHIEAVYCISGEGEIEDLDAGITYRVRPGTFYALDKNDRHRVRNLTRLKLICVFSPALVGTETHDADNGYSLPEDGE